MAKPEGTYLPWRAAWVIIAFAVGVCFGRFWPYIGRFVEEVSKVDPWNASDVPLHGFPKYLVLLLTGLIAWKQMSYYYIGPFFTFAEQVQGILGVV